MLLVLLQAMGSKTAVPSPAAGGGSGMGARFPLAHKYLRQLLGGVLECGTISEAYRSGLFLGWLTLVPVTCRGWQPLADLFRACSTIPGSTSPGPASRAVNGAEAVIYRRGAAPDLCLNRPVFGARPPPLPPPPRPAPPRPAAAWASPATPSSVPCTPCCWKRRRRQGSSRASSSPARARPCARWRGCSRTRQSYSARAWRSAPSGAWQAAPAGCFALRCAASCLISASTTVPIMSCCCAACSGNGGKRLLSHYWAYSRRKGRSPFPLPFLARPGHLLHGPRRPARHWRRRRQGDAGERAASRDWPLQGARWAATPGRRGAGSLCWL